MTPADFHRQRAEDCFLLAYEISDPHEREIMHELALYWLRLFERANENGQQLASRDRTAAKTASVERPCRLCNTPVLKQS
jgi:hypothetical protein